MKYATKSTNDAAEFGVQQPMDLILDAPVATHRLGLWFVTTSRTGYGDSTRHPGRRLLEFVADTAGVLDMRSRRPGAPQLTPAGVVWLQPRRHPHCTDLPP